MVSAPAVASRRASVGLLRGLAKLTLATAIMSNLSIMGCDDEPTCVMATSLTGGYTDVMRWNLSGRDSCGVGSPANLDPNGSVLVFVNKTGPVTQHLFLVPETGIPQVGVYPGRILLIAGGNIWDSGAGNCTIQITRFEFEEWSLINFINITGQAVCTTPLISSSPAIDDASFTEVLQFSAHLHDEQLSFEFL
jgi:hypothetical protein